MNSGNTQIAVFGGGCFWYTEAVFERLRGVRSVMSGYAGGETANPTYEEVSSGRTGHAEVLRVEYDPSEITFETLLNVFFATHDPTTMNRQGNDVGTQYRSIILYTSDTQRREAEAFIEKLTHEDVFDAPIVTEVKPLEKFYEAEEYHQEYYRNNPDKPYCQAIINPKVAKLRQKFAPLLKKEG